jgi:ACS family glucarate transporter-like MFS transporter
MTGSSTSHVRWFLIFWLFVLSAVAFLDRVNISIAGSSIASEYHLSNVELGWVFSSFLAGYALFQTLGGRLADRFGPRRVLAAGVVWWGVFTALTASVPHGIAGALLLFVSIRFLFGAGEAVVYPASNQFVSRWIPTQERGIANGWIFAGVGAGAGLSPPLITFIMLHYGWRASFWFCAVIGLVVGLVWFISARDTPAEHSRVSASEMALIHSGVAPAAGLARGSQLIPWGTVLKSKDVLAVTISYFSFVRGWIFFSWFYTYLPGSWTESEGQRVLRDASFSGHVGWLRSGRDDQ